MRQRTSGYIQETFMACVACGDVGQTCCANSSCTKGSCKDGTCQTSGQWGYPCNTDGSCDEGLTCNPMAAAGKICQNSASGAPEYGSSCFDDKYCTSLGGNLHCVADLVTPTQGSTHFTRCGCDAAGVDCGKDPKTSHARVCGDPSSPQNWDPLPKVPPTTR